MILVAQGVVFAVFLAAPVVAVCLAVPGDADYLVVEAAVAVEVEVVMVDQLHRVLTRRLSAVHVR